METWAIVTLVLGTSAVSSLLTFLITKMQVSHSDKRLTKQLESEREAEYRQRRREVRGEPLLKLRDTLATMATKQENLIFAAEGRAIKKASDEAESELRRAFDDWTTYIGDYQRTLYLQYDGEIVKLVNEIMGEYHKSHIDIMPYNEVSADKLTEALEVCERNKTKIIEVQSLINKRLEEL